MNDIERYENKVLYRSILGREMSSKVWTEILDTICSEDRFGNRPCDDGTICDKCYQKVHEDEYISRLKALAREEQGDNVNLEGYLSTRLATKDSMYAIFSLGTDVHVAYFTKEIIEGKVAYKVSGCDAVRLKDDEVDICNYKLGHNKHYERENSEYNMKTSVSLVLPENVSNICEIDRNKCARFLVHTRR